MRCFLNDAVHRSAGVGTDLGWASHCGDIPAVNGLLSDDFDGRVLPFDQLAARRSAEVVSRRERLGQPIAIADAQIAAVCGAAGATLATRNVADFQHTGIELIDPWTLLDAPGNIARQEGSRQVRQP